MGKTPTRINIRQIGPREWVVERIFPTTARTERGVHGKVSDAARVAHRIAERFGVLVSRTDLGS